MNSTFSRFCIHRAESPIVAASGCPSTSFSPAPSAAVSRFRASKILRLGLVIRKDDKIYINLDGREFLKYIIHQGYTMYKYW